MDDLFGVTELARNEGARVHAEDIIGRDSGHLSKDEETEVKHIEDAVSSKV